ncbi:LysE family translocator [Anderseniella sp. Alg231-50]|uniref:LysE family translocator n=1 Tax=Anderseniella sp. Alg231-50 TaxID=1922226 RepID=UPI00307BA111
MMTLDLTIALAGFAFVSQMSPGPNNFMLMASGMNYGWLRTLPHMLGIGIGFPAMVVLVGLGVMQVFDAVPHSFSVLRILSVTYLVYLAWKIATAQPVDTDATREGTRPLSFVQAAAFQWVNPKTWAMAVTAITAYSPQERPLGSVFFIALVFAVIGTVTINSWTVLGQQLRHLLRTPAAYRSFNICCALVLVMSVYPMLVRGFE